MQDSLAAIGEWASDAPCQVLVALGVRRDPLTGAWQPPGEATVRRVLARIDADALDRAIGVRVAGQQPRPANPHPLAPRSLRQARSTARPSAAAAITAPRRCTCWR